MHLFLLSLLCLAGAVMSQVSKEDFVIISNETSPDDLDLDLMDELERNGTIRNYVTGLLRFDSANSLRQVCSGNASSECPPAYLRLLNLRSPVGVFSNDSGTNAPVNNEDIAARSAVIGGPPTQINYCRHTNRLLSFVIVSKLEVCFVPFPGLQSLTFAVCRPQTRCWRNSLETSPSGFCRSSCHSHRKIFVICVRFFRPFNLYWKSLLVSLPQYCECSVY